MEGELRTRTLKVTSNIPCYFFSFIRINYSRSSNKWSYVTTTCCWLIVDRMMSSRWTKALVKSRPRLSPTHFKLTFWECRNHMKHRYCQKFLLWILFSFLVFCFPLWLHLDWFLSSSNVDHESFVVPEAWSQHLRFQRFNIFSWDIRYDR